MVLDERGLTLVSRAIQWADLALDSAEIRGDDFRAVVDAFKSAHLLALSLRHLHECLKWIDEAVQPIAEWPEDVVVAWRGFEAAYENEDCKHLRDAIEHEAEYIAGKGRLPDRIEGPSDQKGIGFSWGDRLVRIQMRGRFYSLEEPLERAFQLILPLSAWYLRAAGEQWAGSFSRPVSLRLLRARSS